MGVRRRRSRGAVRGRRCELGRRALEREWVASSRALSGASSAGAACWRARCASRACRAGGRPLLCPPPGARAPVAGALSSHRTSDSGKGCVMPFFIHGIGTAVAAARAISQEQPPRRPRSSGCSAGTAAPAEGALPDDAREEAPQRRCSSRPATPGDGAPVVLSADARRRRPRPDDGRSGWRATSARRRRSARRRAARARRCRAQPGDITHIVTVSCTGFAAPNFDLGLVRALGLPRTVARTHVGFMGCHGALNGLRVAPALTPTADPGACVLVCAVELCSLHYQYGWNRDWLVSNAHLRRRRGRAGRRRATGRRRRRLGAGGAAVRRCSKTRPS